VEENYLAGFQEVTSSIGYGKTRKQIRAVAKTAAREKGALWKNRISDGRFRHFTIRNLHCAREIAQHLLP